MDERKTIKKPSISLILILILVLIGLNWGIKSVGNYRDVLEKSRLIDSPTEAQCGVVLTGGAGRVREGIALLSQKLISKVIISGVHENSTLDRIFPEILFYPEINPDDVVLERTSSSTAGNARHSLTVVEALKCQSILLITSDYHLYRAFRTFQRIYPANIKISQYAVASDRLVYRDKKIFDSLYWWTVSEEWVKFQFYRFFLI